MTKNWQRAGFGLYVHWPFCQAKCPYCDFNSHVWSNVDQKRWANALSNQIIEAARHTPERRLTSVFFGGGTPSLMTPETVDQILSTARAEWSFTNSIEVTLEANPTSVEAQSFSGYRDAGVNRVSVGIQALNNADLKNLGRLHTAEEALQALQTARTTFDRVSFDLIYARQFQSLLNWEDELTSCIALNPDHLSLYQLTIEPNTAFGARYDRGSLAGLPSDDLSADMYELTSRLTNSAGYETYEISNYARAGQHSKHNMIYWQGGDYVGVGPGAHGRLTRSSQRIATTNVASPGAWLKAVEQDVVSSTTYESLSSEEHAVEYVLMSLRLRKGLDQNHLEKIDARTHDILLKNIDKYQLPIEQRGDYIRIADDYRILTNAVLTQLLSSSGSAG